MVTRFNLSDEWFEFVRSGIKTVEGRMKTERFINLKVGDIIEFYNDNENINVYVKKITEYKNFRKMLLFETLPKVLPGVNSINNGVKIYNDIYKDENIESHNVIAIEFKLI